MTFSSRRSLLAAGAATFLCAGFPRVRAQNPSSKLAGPRYLVTIFLRGGIDAVYTTDPKTRAEVEPRVDVPYGANEIVDAGGMLFGPHFKPLVKWAPKMAVVRGVQVRTANHETGAFQIVRMRTGVVPTMPSLHDIIGQTRDGQALSSVMLGDISSFEHTPGELAAPTGRSDSTSLDVIDEMSDEEIAILARSYAQHAKSASKWRGSMEVERTREHVLQTAAFFEKLKTITRFKGGRGQDLQRALWFIENDLARGVCVKIVHDWDSHYRNVDKQIGATRSFLTMLERFLDDLHSKKNEHGTLADNTLVVIGSELGRFPVINGNLGKDHWPEAPYILMGPGLNTGKAFGQTGKFMEGGKVSFATGANDAAGDHLILDDLGTTLVQMAGLNPSVYGYNGRRMRFLERT